MSLHDLPVVVERGVGRPKGGYKDPTGARVPSVTTILGRCKESGGLIGWAWKQGRDGISLDDARKKGADVGSLVHDRIEAAIHGDDDAAIIARYAAEGVDVDAAARAFEGFLRWRDETRLQVFAVEIPLAVEGWAGTVDAMARDSAGNVWTLDWKSSAAVYVDMIAQIAAYSHLWFKCRGEQVTGGRILRVSKSGSVHEHRYEREHLLLGWDYFQAARALYTADAALKGVL